MVNKPYCADLYEGDDVVGNNDEGFAQVKAQGVIFLDHKASQGTDEADTMVGFRRTHWMDGVAVPVTDVDGTKLLLPPKFGFYHYNGGAPAKDEANHFISVVKPMFQAGDDLCLDWEDIGASGIQMSAAWADQFCDVVEQWCGFYIKVYGGDAPREQLSAASSAVFDNFTKRPLWFCDYGPYNANLIPGPWKAVGPAYWQDDGDKYGPGPHRLPGIGNYCDNSTVIGSMTVAKLHAQWGGGKVAA
jgi:hypothetical protein